MGAIFLAGTVILNSIVKNKLENFIKQRLPDNMDRAYDAITVETFGGSLAVSNASLIIKNPGNGVAHTFINVEKLKISNVSYWDYLINNEISVNKIELENPKIIYYQTRMEDRKDTVPKAVATIYKPISVGRVELKNSKFVLFDGTEDSTKVYVTGLSLDLRDIRADNQSVKRKIPFNYTEFEATSDTVFVKISPYENLSVEDFSIKNNTAFFKHLKLKTKYSKKELSKIIFKERDHFDLTLDSMAIKDFDFGFANNRFFARSKMVFLNKPVLEIFRDKLVADDLKSKPFYSKMLRELPFDLTVDSIKIADAFIQYEERQKAENMGGSIKFKNLDAAISNVSNTYKKPEKTILKITADFMENTPMSVDWNFDVQNESDSFLFKAKVGALEADQMNSFTEPNLNVLLEGSTNQAFFTIDGNHESSTTALKISYTDFKVTVLQKDGQKKNKILTAVTDLFISKDSKKQGENYKEGTAEATRDQTKSVFNFLWISVKSALVKAML